MNLLQRILQSKTLERWRRTLGKATGLHIRLKRFTASASPELRTAMILREAGIDLVFDIGANTGQFAEALFDFGYQGRVVSFEPTAAAYAELKARAARYPQWEVAERCAIGDQDGLITMNVSDDSVFSSALEIDDAYTAHNPKARIVKKEEVPAYRMDTLYQHYLQENPKARILLKIDTQGFEKQVLDGSRELIRHVRSLKIEIPLYPIYRNTGFSFYEIIDYARQHGFQPYSIQVEGVDLPTGRVNTIDGLFVKEG